MNRRVEILFYCVLSRLILPTKSSAQFIVSIPCFSSVKVKQMLTNLTFIEGLFDALNTSQTETSTCIIILLLPQMHLYYSKCFRNKLLNDHSNMQIQYKGINIYSGRCHRFDIISADRGKMRSTLWPHCCPWRPSWLHKAKSKAGYSQNAFHRGQYANFSTAANGSSAAMLQIQEGPDRVTWQRHQRDTCSRKKEWTEDWTCWTRLYVAPPLPTTL